ncbi:MAG: sulfotransferase domain-containing protein [Halobacteria archaeon]
MKVGFPKSGTTWVNFLLANTFALSAGLELDIHFRNFRYWVATSDSHPSAPPLHDYPKIISNHNIYEKQVYLDKDTISIYVMRHPGDVMESYYHFESKAWMDGPPINGFKNFIRDENWGIPSWKKHVSSWKGNWDVLVKFEDLKKDPEKELEKILDPLDLEVEDTVIERAVEASSFNSMKRMEEKYGRIEKNNMNPEFKFMREGESDGGKDYFDAEDYRYMEENLDDLLEDFGYSLPEGTSETRIKDDN